MEQDSQIPHSLTNKQEYKKFEELLDQHFSHLKMKYGSSIYNPWSNYKTCEKVEKALRQSLKHVEKQIKNGNSNEALEIYKHILPKITAYLSGIDPLFLSDIALGKKTLDLGMLIVHDYDLAENYDKLLEALDSVQRLTEELKMRRPKRFDDIVIENLEKLYTEVKNQLKNGSISEINYYTLSKIFEVMPLFADKLNGKIPKKFQEIFQESADYAFQFTEMALNKEDYRNIIKGLYNVIVYQTHLDPENHKNINKKVKEVSEKALSKIMQYMEENWDKAIKDGNFAEELLENLKYAKEFAYFSGKKKDLEKIIEQENELNKLKEEKFRVYMNKIIRTTTFADIEPEYEEIPSRKETLNEIKSNPDQVFEDKIQEKSNKEEIKNIMNSEDLDKRSINDTSTNLHNLINNYEQIYEFIKYLSQIENERKNAKIAKEMITKFFKYEDKLKKELKNAKINNLFEDYSAIRVNNESFWTTRFIRSYQNKNNKMNNKEAKNGEKHIPNINTDINNNTGNNTLYSRIKGIKERIKGIFQKKKNKKET